MLTRTIKHGDIMKMLNLFMLCVVVGMVTATAVSAEECTKALDDNLDIAETVGPVDCIDSVLFIDSNTNSVSLKTRNDNAVFQGETESSTLSIGNEIKSITIFVTWDNPNNSLTLTVDTPNGNTLGPFDDEYNGDQDGNIGVKISAPEGTTYPPEAEWGINVYGEQIGGSESQSFYVTGTWENA